MWLILSCAPSLRVLPLRRAVRRLAFQGPFQDAGLQGRRQRAGLLAGVPTEQPRQTLLLKPTLVMLVMALCGLLVDESAKAETGDVLASFVPAGGMSQDLLK